MKKFLLIATLGCIGFSASAQLASDMNLTTRDWSKNYSLVSVSYDNTQLWANYDDILDVMGYDGKESGALNGFGLQYTYGIGITSMPMNIELGLKWYMGFNSQTQGEEYYGDYYEYKFNTQLMRLSIPVSYIYHFKVTDMIAVSPYAGLDFRFNLLAKTKFKSYDDGDLEYDESWNWFDKDDMDDWNTAKRFQLGWHIGVRAEISRCFIGLEYGTDFMSFWSEKDGRDKYHINTGNFALSLGYRF